MTYPGFYGYNDRSDDFWNAPGTQTKKVHNSRQSWRVLGSQLSERKKKEIDMQSSYHVIIVNTIGGGWGGGDKINKQCNILFFLNNTPSHVNVNNHNLKILLN